MPSVDHAIELCCGRLGERKVQAGVVARAAVAMCESFAACAAEKYTSCSRFCMSSPSVSSTRELAPVCANTSRSIVEVEPQRIAKPKPFGKSGGVDVHDHVDERFDLRRAARPRRCSAASCSSARASAASARTVRAVPPTIRYSLPFARLRDGTGHAGFDALRAARLARRSTSTWTFGVIVAQLTKIFTLGAARAANRPTSAKMRSIAASSVTTVMMTSASSVTSRQAR